MKQRNRGFEANAFVPVSVHDPQCVGWRPVPSRGARRGSALGVFVASLVLACSGEARQEEGAAPDIVVPDEPVPGVSAACGSVRLTTYEAGDGGWCEFRHSHSILPEFVREGLTLAIAEPYNGGSYEGAPGEACGECWEIDTITETRIVMVDNLCPIEGNPLCAGGHFHFDLTQQAGAALGGGGLDEATARRVPCPVTGNIHAQINDRNEWGYVRLAFVNHRFPIRAVEYRGADQTESDWVSVERSGGAWHVADGGDVFANGRSGGVFRFTSATGEVLEGSAVLTEEVTTGSLFDTGTQFAEVASNGGSCEFVPPGWVYDEGWGGIDQVRWQPNPWGNARAAEVTDDCAEDSESCVLISNLEQWAGFHLYYRQPFPVSTFSSLSLQLKARSGGGTVLVVAPSADGERCEETRIEVTEDWTRVQIDVSVVCSGGGELNGVTVSNEGSALDLLVDEVRYE